MIGAGGMSFPVALHVTAEHAALDFVLKGRSLALASLVNADGILREGKAAVVQGSEILSGKSYWMKSWGAAHDVPREIDGFASWLRDRISSVCTR